jgi:TRAP-type C4-dicarboxylate transport system permease small subunit
VASVLFAALTIVVAIQVLTRFVLHVPVIWSEEVARFLFFWVALLGAAMSVRTRRHFVIDVTMGRAGGLPRLLRRLIAVFPDICVLAFSIFLAVQGVGYARAGLFRTATNSGINMVVVYGAIPVFAALSVIYAATNLARDIVAARADGVPPVAPAGGAE